MQDTLVDLIRHGEPTSGRRYGSAPNLDITRSNQTHIG